MKNLAIIGITLGLLVGLALWQQKHIGTAKAASPTNTVWGVPGRRYEAATKTTLTQPTVPRMLAGATTLTIDPASDNAGAVAELIGAR